MRDNSNGAGEGARDDASEGTRDTAGDTIWLSYDEMAKALGIKRSSARRLTQRRRWHRRGANDATARVAVPMEVLARRRQAAEIAGEVARDDMRDVAGGVMRDIAGDEFSHKVTALEARLEAANEQIGQLESKNATLIEQLAQQREARAAAEALAAERAQALAWLTRRRRWWQLRRKPRD